MLRRLRNLYKRYAAAHFSVPTWSAPLRLPNQQLVGHLDKISIVAGQLIVEGWSVADRLTFMSGCNEEIVVPNLLREDVATQLNVNPDCGFHVCVPWENQEILVSLELADEVVRRQIDFPKEKVLLAANWRVRLNFVRDLLLNSHSLLRLFLFDNPITRSAVKTRLGFTEQVQKQSLETRIFEREGLSETPLSVPITIILPAYNAFEVLKECLHRVSKHTDLPWHLIIIEDASTDQRVRPWLRVWSDWYGERVTLIENESNQGFIGSVNRGFELAIERGEHVVLLNSDALVPNAWASRLIRPITQHHRIASVTPMSNDATILSVPDMHSTTQLEPGQADAIDEIARKFNPEAELSVLPTGVGFCMGVNIEYLRRVPSFDHAFGRGYGEEVDWCQKVRKIGGRHVGLPGLFVEHRGGESFGCEAKERAIRENNRIVSKRYIRFDSEVAEFISNDPMATARLTLSLAKLQSEAIDRIPLYLAHSLGGGAESYLKERIKFDVARGPGAVVIRVGGRSRWRLEIHTDLGVMSGETSDFSFLLRLISLLPSLEITYSCAVGDTDPADIPSCLLRIGQACSDSWLEVLFHDYFPLSPSYTLLDSKGIYRDVAALNCKDRAHFSRRLNGDLVDLDGWRAAWGRLLRFADRVTVFSQDSRDKVLQVYPHLSEKTRVQPHKLIRKPELLEKPNQGEEIIAVLGNIGKAKGAAIVQELARRIEEIEGFRLVLIGNIDPNFQLPASVKVTGTYQRTSVSKIAKELCVTRWLIPSIWPETFSYTTHEALATGLPVHAFHIGAQGSAVAQASNGNPVHFDPGADLVGFILDTIPQRLIAEAA